MAEFGWRVWLKERIDALAGTTGIPPAQVHAAGSLSENLGVLPAIIIKVGDEVPGPFPGVSTRTATIWVHDSPGSYLVIDKVLDDIKNGLAGQVKEPGAVSCRWIGDSTELADDGFHTITRNTSFTLQGKDGSNA